MSQNSTYELPFIPSAEWNFDNTTASLNATHYRSGLKTYDTHSLFGHMQSKLTWEVLSRPTDDRLLYFKDRLQFIASRSTFTGTG